jgi:hypothetical protein
MNARADLSALPRAGHRLLDRRQPALALAPSGPPAAALATERFGALAHQSAIAPTATKFRNALKRRDVPKSEVA